MKAMKMLPVLALAAMLGGCAGTQFGDALGVNEPGQEGELSPDIKERAEAMLKATLKDPYSAVIEVGEPEKGSCQVGVYGRHHGWRVPISYNAKNSFGAYTGLKRQYWWFNGGEFTKLSETPDGLCY